MIYNINVRVRGFVKSEMWRGLQEFTIIQRSTSEIGLNNYVGLLDNGLRCVVVLYDGHYYADDVYGLIYVGSDGLDYAEMGIL